ncbi:hypothetical protein GGI25_000720 [Coemansia spiralis]|uniref:tRNA (guanine-N(7)-)-methyltransferase non-catalytic subunit TRM82 n=2 Tax=Coemansia TaxID=4863 RepID=A0A9W8KZ63_9FUNG|nr:hypothetical protein EDC05_000677 [Coemansia umbellata]KAJ2680428.1 hypothetical protein GGI25_000720 [Coemansia spiralis]
MPYTSVTVVEANSCRGAIALVFDSDFHVTDSKGKLLASTAADLQDNAAAIKIANIGKGGAIKAAVFSRDGSLFAICTLDKNLLIYETTNWSCLLSTSTEKRTNAICFDPTGEYLVTGDKFGDSYKFKVGLAESNNSDTGREKPGLVLGHVSILCDVAFSYCLASETQQQYILTCDRDEKIRISKYPNAYNIQAFCLGHTEFVTTVAPASFAPANAVTGSGDGTIRLWEISTGKLLQTVELKEFLAKYYADGRAVCGENTYEDRTAASERYGVLRVRVCEKQRAFVAVVERIPAAIILPFESKQDGEHGVLGNPQLVDLVRAPTDVAVLDDSIIVSLAPVSSAPQADQGTSNDAPLIAALRLGADSKFVHDKELTNALNGCKTKEVALVPAIGSVFVWGNKMYLERPKGEDQDQDQDEE